MRKMFLDLFSLFKGQFFGKPMVNKAFPWSDASYKRRGLPLRGEVPSATERAVAACIGGKREMEMKSSWF